MHTTIIHRESTNSKESGHISALGKKKKKNSIKAIRQQKNGNSIPIQNEHNYERDIYIYISRSTKIFNSSTVNIFSCETNNCIVTNKMLLTLKR